MLPWLAALLVRETPRKQTSPPRSCTDAGDIRIHRQSIPGSHSRENSYKAAVVQTAFPCGPDCCPGPVDPAGCGCAGAETFCGLKQCEGTQEQRASVSKLGNLQRIKTHIARAAAEGADIVVFSEGAFGIGNFHYETEADQAVSDRGGCASGGLAERIPDPRGAPPGAPIVPCLDQSASRATPALFAVSCAARAARTTVVFALGDVQPCSIYPHDSAIVCSECPPEGVFRFNTLIAIGDKGELLAKYHKEHPYSPGPVAHCIGDGHLQPGLNDPPAVFMTSFGVRFVLQLCYDVMFHTPAGQAVLEKGVSDVILASHWENAEGPPMAMATALFASYSRGYGINLLAAGAGLGFAHTGSGIYSFGDALATAWDPLNPHEEVMLIASVPKLRQPKPNCVNHAVVPWGIAKPPFFDPPAWQTVALPAGASRANLTLLATNRRFRCHFEWQTVPSSQHATYVAMALDGAFFGGALPARACIFYAVPPSTLRKSPWKPWVVGGPKTYGMGLAQAAADIEASSAFASLSVEGDFYDGDIVLPMLAGERGAPASHVCETIADGRGLRLSSPSRVTQAMLYLNTHPPQLRLSTEHAPPLMTTYGWRQQADPEAAANIPAIANAPQRLRVVLCLYGVIPRAIVRCVASSGRLPDLRY